MSATETSKSGGRKFVLPVLILLALAILVSLGTWQVQRLHWKEGLLARIDSRIHSKPVDLAAIETAYANGKDIDYRPVTVSGTFVHKGERHFLSTWHGASGFDIHTPLRLADGRYILINRGFVPYDRKDAATRQAGEVEGKLTVTGLARTAPPEKPSYIVPTNEPKKNVFYWKDLNAMAASAGLPKDATVLPFYIDADDSPNPGGLPVGGVTLIDLPNNHLQYAVTWYGLAVVLCCVVFLTWRERRKKRSKP